MIRIWRADTGECLQTLEDHSKWVTSVTFSHDSALVASGSGDGTIRIWRADTGECMQTLEDHYGSIGSVAFSHDSTLVASGSEDRRIRIWRADTGECMQTLEGHSSWVESVAFSHDSTLVASSSGHAHKRIWRVDTGECVQTLDVALPLSCISFESGSSRLPTDQGAIAIQVKVPECSSIEPLANTMPACRSFCGISNDGRWVTWNEERLLWLPNEYQALVSAVSGSTVAIGSGTGRMIVIGFSLHGILEVFTERKG